MQKMTSKIASLILLLSVVGIASCNKSQQVDLEIGTIRLTIPAEWEVSRSTGIDSYVSHLITAANDTFHLEYGKKGIVDNLYYSGPAVFPLRERHLMRDSTGTLPSSGDLQFSDTPEEDIQQNTFDRNYYRYDTLSGIIVKLIMPKTIGNGITGMYVPTLSDGSAFSMYVKNASPATHEQAIAVFKTIRY